MTLRQFLSAFKSNLGHFLHLSCNQDLFPWRTWDDIRLAWNATQLNFPAERRWLWR